ncbi:rRNA biogenesis protein RRP36 [Debaryomyces fabryi]|uniref:rRNA biogenesis protein RRP36 n=1 Tax=Debaryomyces fabryi TaxID=58627 RepID=A0A0V1PV59_9ASCO|nr:rRNA biogenesis protein RRP36 [Debaryomyces fabryi]KRZ99993.1 rRNA biogenesis protein RRP36 [Debaryomyces fabryi]CUM54707.1 unnamed protein product [Debaryomyces fabryi]
MAKSTRGKPVVIRPSYDDDSESDGDLSKVLQVRDEPSDDEDDDMNSISFGALNAAQRKLEQKAAKKKGGKSKKKSTRGDSSDSDSDNDSSDEEGDFFETSDNEDDANRHSKVNPGRKNGRRDVQKKKNKHAPSEASSKRPVSKVRDIGGLENKTMYRDIRFDPAYGKANLDDVRKNYSFLDDYRQQEVQEMEQVLKKDKNLSQFNKQKLEFKVQSLKSRLDTLNNRDLENKILSEHKKEQLAKFKSGKQANPYFLKKSDKRKLIQKAKFDNMKASQREKVMERKRKRRLGKEFKELEFNRH